MSMKLDKILVVDVESTCWLGKPPPGEKREIIEVGWCEIIPESEAIIGKETVIVRPESSKISKFCTELTTLKQEDVSRGISLREACKMLPAKNRVWASYGNYDREKFVEECRWKNVKYPFGPSHINVKTLFALAHNLPKEVSLREALGILNFSFEGTHHRGGDDAWNIAKVLLELIKRLKRATRGSFFKKGMKIGDSWSGHHRQALKDFG